MKRKPSPPAKDIRAPWQIAQAAACPCRGTDDMCQCQNERPEDRRPTRADLEQRIRELEGAVRTLELQQQTDRQTIASLLAARPAVVSDEVVRDMAGETICGFRVAAYRETHPEHGDKYGHQYSEHWSTPSKNPAVKVERLFTEDQLRAALALLPGVEGEGSSRSLPSRTAQEPPSPTPCDLEGK